MITVLVDEIEEVVESMRDLSSSDAAKYGITIGLTSPYYFYGHPVDINKQLILLDKDASTKDKDYPAILLRLPSNEEVSGGMIHYNLNIAIITDTDGDWTSDERYTEKIKPILYPLYELFLDRLGDFGFMWEKGKVPPHTKRDIPYYGVEATQGNKAHIFKNKLDAIEIINLRINKKFKNC